MTLNHAVAVAMVEGPAAGLAMVDAVEAEGRLKDHHRVHLVRGHLLELAGDREGARAELQEAARRTTSLPERRHLERRIAELGEATTCASGGEGRPTRRVPVVSDTSPSTPLTATVGVGDVDRAWSAACR